MKKTYLLLTPSSFSSGYVVRTFDSAQELADYIQEHGAKNAIAAKLLRVELRLCDYEQPAPEEF